MNGLAGLGQPTNPPPELTPFPHPTLPSYAEGGGGGGGDAMAIWIKALLPEFFAPALRCPARFCSGGAG